MNNPLKKAVAYFSIVIIAIASTACGNQKPPVTNAPPKNVKVVNVGKTSIGLENSFAGAIKVADETNVISKVSGKVKSIFADIGKKVNAGDVLFVLDKEELLAQYAQAQAGVELARANLEKTKNSGLEQPLLQEQMGYNQAQAGYDQLKSAYEQASVAYKQELINFEEINRNYNIKKDLLQSGAISENEFKNIEMSKNMATQGLDASKIRMESARIQMEASAKNLEDTKSRKNITENKSLPENIRISQAQLSQAMAAVQTIDIQIKNASITAPISGVIASKNINIGEVVSPAMSAMGISNTNQLNVEVSIPENLINKFSLGQKLSVAINSLEGVLIDGEVNTIYPVIDVATKNYKIKVRLINPPIEVKPGMFAKIKAVVDSKTDIIGIPNQTIFTENGVQYVYVVKDNKLKKTPVKVGLSNDKEVEVISGVILGDMLIFEGQSFLTDGETVSIVK